MRSPRIAMPALALTLGLGLAGCGGEDTTTAEVPPAQDGANEHQQPAESPSEEAMWQPEGGPGTYSGTTDTGLTITAEVPADPSDPRLSEIEKYREAAGAGPFTYIVAEYDNTQGREAATVWEGMNLVTEGGQTITVPHIAKDGGVLEQQITDEINGPLNDEAWDYYTGLYDRQTVRPGAKETVILAADQETPSIGRVYATIEEYGPEIMLIKE